MEKFILKIWYSNKIYYNIISYLLLPLSFVYILAFYIPKLFREEYNVGIPVICIGNINVGGTGKTSTLLSIVKQLSASGKKVCVLLRGYGGQKTSFKKVLPSDSAQVTGDEAILYSNCVPTYIANNRKNALIKIKEEISPDFIFLDDGFQDKSVFKDKNILMVNGQRGFGNGLCLPAGPLRELIKPAIKKADFLIIVGEDDTRIDIKLKNTDIVTYSAVINVVNIDKNKNYLAFSGIGNNQSFFNTLKQNDYSVFKTIEFPDHHYFSKEDLDRLNKIAAANNLTLITTEKDFVRIPEEIRLGIECLKIEIALDKMNELINKLTN